MIATRGKYFAEVTRHRIWGTGVPIYSNETFKKDKWSGKNLIGWQTQDICIYKWDGYFNQRTHPCNKPHSTILDQFISNMAHLIHNVCVLAPFLYNDHSTVALLLHVAQQQSYKF